MDERFFAAQSDIDPSNQLNTRNRELERLLNPENSLPEADAYPILGATFSEADLASKYPAGALLPTQEAVASGRMVSMIVGAEGKIAAGMIITPDNGLGDDSVLAIIDTFGHEQLRRRGYGKKLYLETLKALPLGAELTSHATLLDDGQRMWDWLLASGLAKERADYDSSNEVAGKYITRLSEVAASQP